MIHGDLITSIIGANTLSSAEILAEAALRRQKLVAGSSQLGPETQTTNSELPAPVLVIEDVQFVLRKLIEADVVRQVEPDYAVDATWKYRLKEPLFSLSARAANRGAEAAPTLTIESLELTT